MDLRILGSEETIPLESCAAVPLAGARMLRAPDGRVLAPAFRAHAVDLGDGPLPEAADDGALAALVLDWVGRVRAHDWSDLRGTPLEAGDDWLDLRTAMVRVGWDWFAAQAAWEACRERPYARQLPTAAAWAAAGWVVPAAPGEPDPAFAHPVLEARGLLRWAYIGRWDQPVAVPDGPPPADAPDDREAGPGDLGWADVVSRLRQDHYTQATLTDAAELASDLLHREGLGPTNPLEAEDDPLPDRDVAAATTHASGVIRAAAWFLLREEADSWLACAYAECQHHWAVEAEEDAYELDEVLELAGHGVANPVDAAYQRRRLLTLAFGDVRDVPLAGAGDLDDFIAFYTGWVDHGRPEEDFEAAAAELRGDDA